MSTMEQATSPMVRPSLPLAEPPPSSSVTPEELEAGLSYPLVPAGVQPAANDLSYAEPWVDETEKPTTIPYQGELGMPPPPLGPMVQAPLGATPAPEPPAGSFTIPMPAAGAAAPATSAAPAATSAPAAKADPADAFLRGVGSAVQPVADAGMPIEGAVSDLKNFSDFYIATRNVTDLASQPDLGKVPEERFGETALSLWNMALTAGGMAFPEYSPVFDGLSFMTGMADDFLKATQPQGAAGVVGKSVKPPVVGADTAVRTLGLVAGEEGGETAANPMLATPEPTELFDPTLGSPAPPAPGVPAQTTLPPASANPLALDAEAARSW